MIVQRPGRDACEPAQVAPLARVPPGVEVCRRISATDSFLFLLNHGDSAASVELPHGGLDLLACADVDTRLELEPLGVAVVRERRVQ
jgi:beta-galactosidase